MLFYYNISYYSSQQGATVRTHIKLEFEAVRTKDEALSRNVEPEKKNSKTISVA